MLLRRPQPLMQETVGRSRPALSGDDAVADVIPLRDMQARASAARQPSHQPTAPSPPGETRPRLGDEDEGVGALHLRLERMLALDKLKSDFMNLTTHELRSPLAIVYGYLSMLDSGMLGELSKVQREAVSSSIQSVELMTQLVTELVEMARLDETRLDPTRDPVDLVDLVAEAAARVESSERHRLRLDLGAGPAPVLGDRGQLLRVFSNLVDNAVKYSPDGGEIAIRLRRVGRQVAVEITDQGLGIATEDMSRLFTRFGRIVTTATEGIGGTGLGLYLCRELVRRLGGDVTATSAEGAGSTFTVRLPAATGSASSRRSAG